VNKTKYIKCSRNQVKEQIVDLGGIEIGNVQSFRYLGSVVNTTLSKKYPTLGQEKKVAYLGEAQFVIPFKVGPL
jgi:hypothetical protein